MERGKDVFALRAECTDQSGDERTETNDGDCEHSHHGVKVNVLHAAHVLPRAHKPLQCDFREAETEDSAEDGKKQTLQQALAHEAEPPTAERGADGKILTSRSGPCNQQIGDIEACNEQN